MSRKYFHSVSALLSESKLKKDISWAVLSLKSAADFSPELFDVTGIIGLNINIESTEPIEIPDEIANMQGVLELNINANISHISPKIATLERLHTLKLQGDLFEYLPETIAQIPNLQELTIVLKNSNKNFTLPHNLGLLKLLKSFSLDAGFRPLFNLEQSGIGSCTLIERFQLLNAPSIKVLPNFFDCWTNLKDIYIKSTSITALPPSLARINTIQSAYLEYNQFAVIPPELQAHTSLRVLILCQNKITTIPDWISNMKDLQSLDLGHNLLTTIPESFKDAKSIYSLNVAHNKITHLPDIFSSQNLPALGVLDISYNQLTQYPSSFRSFNSLLSRLKLWDNPWQDAPIFFLYYRYDNPDQRGFETIDKPINIRFFDPKRVLCDYYDNTLSGESKFPRVFASHYLELQKAIYLLNPPDEYILPLYYIFCKDKQQVKNYDLFPFLLALSAKYSSILQKNATAFIEERESKRWKKQPINNHAVVALLGSFATDAVVIAAQLENAGIKTHTEVTADTSHAFVGMGITPEIYATLRPEILIGTPSQLKDLLEQKEQFHFVQESKTAKNSQDLAALRAMLLSNNNDSIGVALEMMASGGVPHELHSLLFALAVLEKYTIQDDNRQRIIELLRLHAHKDLLKVAEKLGKNYSTHITKAFWTPLWNLVQKGILDWSVVQPFLDKHYHYHAYYWDSLPPAQAKEQIHRFIIENNGIAHSWIYKEGFRAFLQFPELRRFYYSNNRGNPFPIEIYTATNLEFLSLSNNDFHNIPDGIQKLTKLTRLELWGNKLQFLPPMLNGMTHLTHIGVEENIALKKRFDQHLFEVTSEPVLSWKQYVLVRKNIE